MQTCEDGFYPDRSDATSNKCTACAEGCATCFGGTVNDCLTCDTHTNMTKYYKVIGKTICSTTCPQGQFIDSNIDFLCQACSSACQAC